MPVDPEVVTFRTSSGFKIYTGGVDTNGLLPGSASHTTIKAPVELMIVTAPGVAAVEYQVVRLHPDKQVTRREFRAARFGFAGSVQGVERDKLMCGFKKVGDHEAELVFEPELAAGEYAILPPPVSGSLTNKAFTFRVE